MLSVATLISRAARHYLGVGAQTVAREVAREAAGKARAGVEGRAVRVTVPVRGRLARAVFAFWLAGLALFALVVVNVDLVLPGGVSSPFRLVVGLVLLIEGAGLLVRRLPFRTVLIARLTAGSLRHPSPLRRAALKHLIGAGLTLLGFVWVAAGLLDLLRGVNGLL